MSFKVYNPQVERTAAPAYRQRIDNSVSAGMASLAEGARGVAAGADELRQQIRDEQDVAALQDAYRQLSDAKQHLLDDPNEGFIAKRGRDAIEAGKKYVGSFDDTAKRIGEGLRSDRQKQAFTRTLGDERRGFLDTVDRHVAGQSVVVADQARDGAMTAGFSEAVAASKRGDIDIAQKAIAKGAAAAADIPGADPGFIAAQQAAYVTQAHLGIIDGMMEGGQTTAAEKYLEAHRGEMDAALLAKSNIEKSIRLAGDAETGARLARGMIGGASGTVVRPWDPKTQIPHLDTSRVMAELAKVEADPSVPEHVKQATREHAEALVRSNDATWKSMLDDTYDRAVTKLSTNGWRLSSLSQEQAFLLSPDVDGGRVWQSILAHRDSVLRARSGAPSTPAQHAAMVEFLLTLPDRQNDYMTGDPKAFMTEWGPRLAPSDLEQAAGYVSKAGLGAARPDATLPSPVIARIKQEGGPGGYGLWGTKGPKDDGENASYLTIYNDLLATQAQLKREGKKLDDAAVKDRLAFWGAKGKVPGSGWFVDDRVARAQFEGNPEYAGKVFDEEIPEATRASIREVLRAGGRPVTEEWVTWTWRDAHGVPAEQNPQPSPVSPEVARDAERANQPLPESYGR